MWREHATLIPQYYIIYHSDMIFINAVMLLYENHTMDKIVLLVINVKNTQKLVGLALFKNYNQTTHQTGPWPMLQQSRISLRTTAATVSPVANISFDNNNTHKRVLFVPLTAMKDEHANRTNERERRRHHTLASRGRRFTLWPPFTDWQENGYRWPLVRWRYPQIVNLGIVKK